MNPVILNGIVFAVSFVACAYTLGKIFIKPSEFAILNASEGKPPEPPQAEAAAAQPEASQSLADTIEIKLDGDGGAEADNPYDDMDDDEEEDETTAATEDEFRDSRVSMMKFLEEAIAGLATDGFKLDSFNKFGCHLFLAGAAEACAREGLLGKRQFAELLGKCVAVLGSKPEMAKTFSKRYEEYLLEPKYAEMFRAGGTALTTHLADGGGDAAAELERALEVWKKPAAEAGSGSDLVAVMLTDLVGSTAMTQERGDAGAQEVVRTHNQIVRAVLKRHNGFEVKHTGDGIMARFDSTANAVTGSLEMQAGLAAHNSAHPELPVNVRIGINSGTPIQEDDDLFGTTVQLAARICDKGQAGRVMTSNVVRELCAGQNVRFEEGGAFDLKVVEGPVTLYFAEPSS